MQIEERNLNSISTTDDKKQIFVFKQNQKNEKKYENNNLVNSEDEIHRKRVIVPELDSQKLSYHHKMYLKSKDINEA